MGKRDKGARRPAGSPAPPRRASPATARDAAPLLLTVLGAVVLMFRIDPSLAALVTILTPLFYLILKVLQNGLVGVEDNLLRHEVVFGVVGHDGPSRDSGSGAHGVSPRARMAAATPSS